MEKWSEEIPGASFLGLMEFEFLCEVECYLIRWKKEEGRAGAYSINTFFSKNIIITGYLFIAL
ncbi:hypothetical protein G7074_00555 [Pedobacter sp. HDW13]|uniref:hypothetical protein n=1 Tax=Pedobacter sp. HDW13 TaxID=2714940 RepID=UPI001407568A|nr:hypothetical protein [Pedobacter sp. HDW13]QIL37904.1 hypothetical protein G7074_00555 [Pedobacter sp. HDW13]